jgi:hypothetical protein
LGIAAALLLPEVAVGAAAAAVVVGIGSMLGGGDSGKDDGA